MTCRALRLYLKSGTLLVQLHDHLLLALVCTALPTTAALGILQLTCLLQVGSERLHLTMLRLLQLQINLQTAMPKPAVGAGVLYRTIQQATQCMNAMVACACTARHRST